MYHYQIERPKLFSESGQILFLKVRDNVHRLLKEAGAVRSQEAVHGPSIPTADSWMQLACLDRLVELGEIREITAGGVPGQYRVFVRRNG